MLLRRVEESTSVIKDAFAHQPMRRFVHCYLLSYLRLKTSHLL